MPERVKHFLDEMSVSAWALLAAGVVVSLITLAIGENPIAVGRALFHGAFGSPKHVANTLQYAVPLTLSGLAVALAFRCGLFNIGVEGQLYIGAFASAMVGAGMASAGTSGIPGTFVVALIVGVLAGAAWAGVAGTLKAFLGVHEVIATIMLNFIALFLTDYLVNHPALKAKGDIPQTAEIGPAGRLPMLGELVPGVAVGGALALAILAAILVWYFLWKTRAGYETRAVGANPGAAEAAGVSVKRRLLGAMLLSGALAGLIGAEEVLGVHHRYILGFSPGYGYIGIAIALLGRNHPVGIICAAMLFASLKGGALRMDALTHVPREMISVLQAIVILFVAAAASWRRSATARE